MIHAGARIGAGCEHRRRRGRPRRDRGRRGLRDRGRRGARQAAAAARGSSAAGAPIGVARARARRDRVLRRGRLRRRAHRHAARSSATRPRSAREPRSAPGSVVGRGSSVDFAARVGDRVLIQTGVYVTAGSIVEDDVFLGPGVLTTNDHTMGRHPRGEPLLGPTFRRACRVGGGAVLVPGVVIGEEAFVAAGALVTRDVGDARGGDGRAGAGGPARPRRGPARAVELSRASVSRGPRRAPPRPRPPARRRASGSSAAPGWCAPARR